MFAPSAIAMWSFASNAIAGSIGPKNSSKNPSQACSEFSDDDASSSISREEGLECPICWESFNIVENVPYVLWCGHTLCKNCVLGLQWAVVKFPTLPIQLPLFISCPWCNLLSFRLVYKGNLKFPRKNFFLLWMVESMTGDRLKAYSSYCGDHQGVWSSSSMSLSSSSPVVRGRSSSRRAPSAGPEQPPIPNHASIINYLNVQTLHSSLRKSLVFFVHLTSKFPLVLVFLLIVLYAIPASAVILALYILVTVLFALPSFLILYFAYPSLDWLVFFQAIVCNSTTSRLTLYSRCQLQSMIFIGISVLCSVHASLQTGIVWRTVSSRSWLLLLLLLLLCA
ncbi:hypothetical protein ACLOJK_038439 [Asimina triloba]